MKFTPFQLLALSVAGFGTIVLLNILAQFRSNAEFKEYLQDLKPADLIPLRNRRIAEENMEPVEIVAVPDNEDESDE